MGEFEISYATRWNVLFLFLVLKSILHFTSHLLILQSKSIKSGWWGGWFTFVQLIVLTFSFCIYSLGKMSIRHFFFFSRRCYYFINLFVWYSGYKIHNIVIINMHHKFCCKDLTWTGSQWSQARASVMCSFLSFFLFEPVSNLAAVFNTSYRQHNRIEWPHCTVSYSYKYNT